MDDGLSFNFAAPAGGGTHTKKAASSKSKATSQRWTDRVKRSQKDKRKNVGQKLVKDTPKQAVAAQGRPTKQVKTSENAQTQPKAIPTAQTASTELEDELPAVHREGRGQPGSKLDSSGPKQKVISSLFSSLPTPAAVKTAAVHVPQEPSNAPAVGSSFSSLGLTSQLSDTLESSKFNLLRPTAIQKQSVPALLTPNSERDHIIQAQTGSGKTLAYLLPIVQDLLSLSIQFAKEGKPLDRSVGTLAIITVPTRELANQIYQVAQNLLSFSSARKKDEETGAVEERYSHRWLTPGLLSGGMDRNHEKAKLRKGVPLLIATPGRLLDHLQTTSSFRMAGETVKAAPDPNARPKKKQKVSEEDEFAYEDQTFDGTGVAEDESDDDDFTKAHSRSYKPRIPNYIPRPAQPDPRLSMRWLVLDEADRLMDMGFEPQIKDILKCLEARVRPPAPERPRRRAVLCSATMQGNVKNFAGEILRNPSLSQSGPEGSVDARHAPPSQLQQSYVVVPPKLRFVALLALLRQIMAPPAPTLKAPKSAGRKVLVFMSCTDSVDLHWSAVGGLQMGRSTDAEAAKKATATDEDGLALAQYCQLMPKTPIYRLHGSLDLPTRMASLKAFTDAPGPAILFCTSLAARGIDVPFVRCVVQCDLPTEGGATEYIHRVGRTARAGTAGEAWAFVLPSEVGWVEWAEKKMAAAEEGAAARLQEVSVDEVLANGLGGAAKDYETRATDVQMAFERWVEELPANANLSRSAFSSHTRAYATHPSEEKAFFHVKNLHLGHLAKAFGLREAPKGMGRVVGGNKATSAKAKAAEKAAGTNGKKRRSQAVEEDEALEGEHSDLDMAELAAAAVEGDKKRVVQPRTGRALEGRGLKPARAGASEFNIGNIGDIDRMLKRRN